MHVLLSSNVFFFFKQKTAYEMRISDGSSDVCSSDLSIGACEGCSTTFRPDRSTFAFGYTAETICMVSRTVCRNRLLSASLPRCFASWSQEMICRSEEHTSELQSLMRISYAVFCLKKKNQPSHIRMK